MLHEHERILSVIADLEDSPEVDDVNEFLVAQHCGLIPANLPRHAFVNSPLRARLLHTLTSLEQGKLIYVTKNGYWRLHLTRAGRARLAEREAAPPPSPPSPEPAPSRPLQVLERPATPPAGPTDWQAPRPALPALGQRNEHFYGSLALTMATIGAVLFFALSHLPQSPLARGSDATPVVAAATPVLNLPAMPPPTPEPTATPSPPPAPAAPPAARAFIVANTGGDGVYLRRSPQLNDRLSAFPERTRLEEIGPETTVDGIVWRHVRAPDGTAGYVPAQYTADAP